MTTTTTIRPSTTNNTATSTSTTISTTTTTTSTSTTTPTTTTTTTTSTTPTTTITTTTTRTTTTTATTTTTTWKHPPMANMDFSKIIILNGIDSLQSVEVVDLSSTSSTCKSLQDYPLNLRGSYGDLINGQTPLVCGGAGTKNCYLYSNGAWTQTFTLNQNRFHFAGMPSSPFRNSTHQFFVIGPTDMEVLTPTGWELLGISLPIPNIYVPCMMVINETSFLLAVGTTPTETYSKDTYIFNAETNSWSRGPTLTNGRRSMGCGTIKESETSSSRIFVIIGGEGAPNSVELLDNVAGSWRAGPRLPVQVYGSRPMVYHPSGGIVAIVQGSPTIYYLAHAAASWVALPQTIKTPRYWTTAFLVPDNLVSCS